MRIACLQFAPQVGDIDNNLNRADAVLSKASPQDLDLLVLPELAFSGYNFKSLQHITPFLEPTTAGITSLWARTTALKYDCVVTVGYPEKVDITPKWPASPEYYNSAITVNGDGETIANYRKSFLYYTDETWALEGPDGFFDGAIDRLGNVAMGICMDLNPYKFESPWSAWEFAYHILHKQANLVILSMAWLTREDARAYSRTPKEPDMETLSYWLARLEPLIRAEIEGEIIVVFANRCGTEEEAVYAGTSAVLGIEAGEVKVYGILGRGERELLVVDTSERPQAKLISQPVFTSHTNPKTSPKSKDPSSLARTSSNPKTDSTVSEKSTLSSSTVRSPTTQRTTPSPATPSALHVDELLRGSLLDVSMDEIICPISPVDVDGPNAFFPIAKHPHDPASRHQALRSSVGHPQGFTSAVPDSEPAPRHEALKSSAEHPQDFTSAMPNSPTFHRPASPKSRNCSRTRHRDNHEPALVSHDLAQEPLVSRSFGIKSPLHSASSMPEQLQAAYPSGTARLRSELTITRPKSTVW